MTHLKKATRKGPVKSAATPKISIASAPAMQLATAVGTLVAYQVRAAVGVAFDPKLLGVAEDNLAKALDRYGRWVGGMPK